MTTEERFDALEKAVRRQRIIIAGMILLMVGLVTIAAAPQSRDAKFETVTATIIMSPKDQEISFYT